LDWQLKKAVDAVAEKYKVSDAEVVRNALKRYLSDTSASDVELEQVADDLRISKCVKELKALEKGEMNIFENDSVGEISASRTNCCERT